MLPHKTKRGAAALERLKVFEGVPPPYDKLKKKVVPIALKNLRIKPGRKVTRLGDLSKEVGWTHDDLVKQLEAKRKTKNAAFYATKKTVNKLKTQAAKNSSEELAPIQAELAKFGY